MCSYLLINFITVLTIPMQQALSPFQLPCSEDTNAHAELIPSGSINNTLIKMASNSRSNLCSP